MSWENELRPEIKFTSPSSLKARGKSTTFGDRAISAASSIGVIAQSGTFTALWRHNERTVEKKLGLFDPPKFQGTIVQDLGSKSVIYPLTVYFDGMFHHRTADAFFEALSTEQGPWEVVHPVHGAKMLQLVSVREVDNPVEAGAYTEIETQWIEPANIERMVSLSELLADTLTSIMALAEDATTLLAQLRADIYSAVQAAANIFQKIGGALDSLTGEISATSAIAADAYASARAAFNSALSAYGVDDPDASDVSEAMVNMTLAPLDAGSDYSGRAGIYSDLADSVFSLAPSTTTADDYNKVVTIEFGATLALMAVAQIAVTSEYRSRADVVAAMDSVTDFMNSVIARIDDLQSLFYDLDIDKQYYSQTATYTTLVNLYTLVFQYLITQFYNLKAEKRFTLKRQRSPLEIAVTEYGVGNAEDIDYYYDLFLTSNHLSGNDILILPAGREVLIYA